jgi:HK97 gp10 family phage protein
MSVKMEVDVEYARELAANLREYFPEALTQKIQDAVAVVGERMANDARQFCPVRTGYLQSTIALDQPGAAKWVFSLLARAPYAVYVEFGTRRMAARLFMTRAVELHTPEMREEVENAVASAIRDTFH